MVWSGLREDDTKDNKRAEPELPAIGFKYLIVTGLALSLDNLVIGFALSFYGVPIPLAAGVIAAVSVSMSLMGLELGGRLGTRFEKWSEELGGAVLILVGLALAIGLI